MNRRKGFKYLVVLSLILAGSFGCELEKITAPEINVEKIIPTACFEVEVIQDSCLTACQVNFNAGCSNNAVKYIWSYGDGSSDEEKAEITSEHTYDSAGSYQVLLKVISTDNSVDSVNKQVIIKKSQIIPIAAFEIAFLESPCLANCTVTLDAKNSINAESYFWELGDGETRTGVKFEYQYKEFGTYPVTLTVTSESNDQGQITKNVVIEKPWECGDILIDLRDGKSYPTLKIGDQCWMAKNLDFREVGFCFNESENNCDNYGSLYGLRDDHCPEGWHVPDDDEWKILESRLGVLSSEIDKTGCRGFGVGDFLKNKADCSPQSQSCGSSGLNLPLGGYYDPETTPFYKDFGSSGVYLTNTTFGATGEWTLVRLVQKEENCISRTIQKFGSAYCRCIKD